MTGLYSVKQNSKYRNIKASLILLVLIANYSQAQVGGRYVYEFLNLPASARLTALGDRQISVLDNDIAMAYDNPAVLNENMAGQLAFNHKFFFDGIDHGYFAYGHKLKKWNLTAHGGIQYIRYGEFVAADIYGNKTGIFKANETAVVFGVSKKIMDRLQLGINTKFIQSRFESYNSFGIAADLGAVYLIPDKQLNIGFVLKNIGVQLRSYQNKREPLPFDVQLGISKRLEHLPFRFSVIAHHLNRWNILYDDPNQENDFIFLGAEQADSKFKIFSDNLFRHVIFSGEFLLGKTEAFKIRMAYNHLRRKELSVSDYRSFAGFSLGFGIKIKKFSLDYGYSIYHLAGGSSHIGISTNLNAFRKKI